MAKSVCVITATGMQGRAVAMELVKRGYTVSTLARNISSKPAQSLRAMGAMVHEGSLGSKEAIQAAMNGAESLFFAVPVGFGTELEYAKSILDVAQANGVAQVIYSSVARTGEHRSFPGWDDEDPSGWYWKQKEAVEIMVRDRGFKHWTILRPAFLMQNFCYPVCDYLFPGLASTQTLQVALNPDTRMNLIHSGDIAVFAANAIDQPSIYHGQYIPLAGHKITIGEVTECLEKVNGKKVTIQYLERTDAEALAAQGREDIVSQLWQKDVGYGVDIEALEAYGVTLTSFPEMLKTAELAW